jgi:hypothetical protein
MNQCVKSSPDTTTDAALEVSTSMFFISVEIPHSRQHQSIRLSCIVPVSRELIDFDFIWAIWDNDTSIWACIVWMYEQAIVLA